MSRGKFIFLLTSLYLLSGCEQGFDRSLYEEQFKTDSSNLSSSNDISGKTSFETFVGISYGFIGEVMDEYLSGVIQKILKQEGCEQAGNSNDRRPASEQYRCGEIPVGQIISANKKSLTTFSVPAKSGTKNGVSYSSQPVQIPLFMSRTQRSSRIRLADLDSWSVRDITTQSQFGKQFFVRANPQNGLLGLDVCVSIPGFDIFSESTKVRGELSRKEFLINIRSDFEVTVDIGRISFDSADLCISTQVSMSPQGKLQFQIGEVQKPKIHGLKRSGYSSSVDVQTSGFLGVVSDLAGEIGLDIESVIADAVKAEVDQLALGELDKIESGDIDSGKWLEKFAEVSIFQKVFVKDIIDGLTGELESRSIASTSGSIDMTEMLAGACSSVVSQVGTVAGLNSDLLYKVCKFLPRVEIQLFQDSAKMREMGCYDYYFNPMERNYSSGVRKWWVKTCQLEQKVNVQAPEEFAQAYACIFESIKNKTSLLKNGCAQLMISAFGKISSIEVQSLRLATQRSFLTDSHQALSRIQSLAEELR